LENSNEDTSTVREYFRLDENSVPPKYVLKPRRPDQKDWWEIFEKIQKQLQLAASKCLDEKDAQKYFISVTEKEIQRGILDNPIKESQTVCVTRDLGDVQNPSHIHRHIIDTSGEGVVDQEAQDLLKDLKKTKLIKSLEQEQVIQMDYEQADEAQTQKYIMDCCDSICHRLAKGILESYSQHLHVEEDLVYSEILQHRNTIADKSSLFVGRDNLLASIMQYIQSNNGEGEYGLFILCEV
jgi:phosphoribosylformylglycinamidine (FGAM) synthase PurS component